MSEPSIVVWLDPGKTTGIAWLETDGFFGSDQFDFLGLGEWLIHYTIMFGTSMHLGWEMYVITGGGGRFGTAGYSLETIGMVKWLTHCARTTVLDPQPSSARKLGDDDKLKQLGWYKPGKRHANDAANHLLSHLLRTRSLPPDLTKRLFTSG